jgi:hypothetical protein
MGILGIIMIVIAIVVLQLPDRTSPKPKRSIPDFLENFIRYQEKKNEQKRNYR